MHHPVTTRPARIGIGVAATLLWACASAGEPARIPRAVQTAPVTLRLPTPLPHGRAEALFRFDTGGDRMTERPKEAGLLVVVRWGDTERRQILASCARPSRGTALGGGTERELDVAMCDGEFWLISEPGRVTVQRLDADAGPREVARFDLPDALRAVTPGDR